MKMLLYGAYGYTGRLIAEEAAKRKIPLILAGRNKKKTLAMSREMELDSRVFDLQPQELDRELEDIDAVLHAAGPFKYTARPMMEACIRTGTHYLDITGELEVFELGAKLGERAAKAEVMIMPGTGFDVVPTDCLALFLKKQLPDALFLQLAFSALSGGLSRGTAMTMAENLGRDGAVRQDGKIVPVSVGHQTLTVPFKGSDRFAMTIPWGDVSTAWYSTGIPNIETYMGISPKAYRMFKWQRRLGWLLRTRMVRALIKRRIRKGPAGPDALTRQTSKSLIWGRVRNAQGDRVEARLVTAEGYTLTAITSLMILERVSRGDAPVGFQTPAKAYGENLILEVEGTVREMWKGEEWLSSL